MAAEDFISKYHPTRTIPLPIEKIVEFDFGIDIVPMPGLHRGFDIDSMITNDLREIRIEQAVFDSYPGRYRFSLAHELGHRVLHQEVFAQIQFRSISEWKALMEEGIPLKEYSFLETQANSFAGLILAPQAELSRSFDKAIRLAESQGLSLRMESDTTREAIAFYISKEFEVSAEVIRRRLDRDRIWEL
ncbi:MAG: ImmA/IrrE family metallo-endopeptidase [Pirellulales bacterium]|nr:ImmA/IrrE family metallo-endopeptidase [Pirellulales bacterium]